VRRFLDPYWSPGLRVLEVCDRSPVLAGDALLHREVDYSCLSPFHGRAHDDDFARIGSRLVGDPLALVRGRLKFDLVAWLREQESLRQCIEFAESLLSPAGLLFLRTADRFNTASWILSEAATLPSGLRLLALRRRRAFAQAA